MPNSPPLVVRRVQANALRDYLACIGLSQEAAAGLCGVECQWFRQVASGHVKLSATLIMRMEAVLPSSEHDASYRLNRLWSLLLGCAEYERQVATADRRRARFWSHMPRPNDPVSEVR